MEINFMDGVKIAVIGGFTGIAFSAGMKFVDYISIHILERKFNKLVDNINVMIKDTEAGYDEPTQNKGEVIEMITDKIVKSYTEDLPQVESNELDEAIKDALENMNKEITD